MKVMQLFVKRIINIGETEAEFIPISCRMVAAEAENYIVEVLFEKFRVISRNNIS